MDIAPGKYNLHIQRGEDFSFTFRLIIKSTGLPVDLTDATIISQIREQDYRGSTLIADFTTLVDGVTTPNAAPTNMQINLSLTDAETAAIEQDGGYYDVLVIDSNGLDKYWVEGRVTIHNSVTVKP